MKENFSRVKMPSWFICLFLLVLFPALNALVKKDCTIFRKDFNSLNVPYKSWCVDIQERGFSVYAVCDINQDLMKVMEMNIKDIQAICLWGKAQTIQPGTFSHFINLTAIYLVGNYHVMPGAFQGLRNLSLLWMESHTRDKKSYITFSSDPFLGLETLKELRIDYVPFSSIEYTIFKPLSQLETLILSVNNITKLSQVTKELGSLPSLKSLSVTYNNIESIRKEDCLSRKQPTENSTVYNMINITFLDLTRNPLVNIEENSLCDFPYLTLLKADESYLKGGELYQSGIQRIEIFSLQRALHLNFFQRGNVCHFASHFQVKELLLTHDHILDISATELCPTSLKKLNIAENSLSVLKTNAVWNLSELSASDNTIQNLELCQTILRSNTQSRLVSLNLASNWIRTIHAKQFFCLGNLRILFLNNNKISEIHDFAFDGLGNLELLNLENNNIILLDKDSLFGLISVKQLSLGQNKIEKLAPKQFQYLRELQEIKISFANSIDYIDWMDYIKDHLHIVSIKTFADFIEMEAEVFNSLVLENVEAESFFLAIDDCTTFPFHKIKDLYVWNNADFICMEPCGAPAIKYFTSLQALYYSSSLGEMAYKSPLNNTLHYLQHLEVLYLQDINKVVQNTKLDVNSLFHGLQKLKMLRLKNAGILYFTIAMLQDLTSLKTFIVEDQIIDELQDGLFNNLPNLEYIYFKNVDFKCNCKLSWMNEWLATTDHIQVFDFYTQDCVSGNLSLNLLQFLEEQCTSETEFVIFLGTFLPTLFFLLAAILYKNTWWRILYLYYVCRARLNYTKKKEIKNQYQYDVFISYSSHDEWWVINQLLPNLEEKGPPFFTVCLHSRDFELGKYIMDNIMESINKSQFTICLITHHYLQSHWCSLEMQMASYRLIAENKNRLLLVILEKIALEEIYHYQKPAQLLQKKTYLEWAEYMMGQQLFWAKLRKTLGKFRENDP
ncbi:toll-like receptor 13 [Protopterus annectens]|uniref:toll-like receptor 13 n=1 Tax=Protopterus annectens TaxID=7888 RepID=UPI001CFB770C|nr:toll-like receptor 13 [Protopterus annectens]